MSTDFQLTTLVFRELRPSLTQECVRNDAAGVIARGFVGNTEVRRIAGDGLARPIGGCELAKVPNEKNPRGPRTRPGTKIERGEWESRPGKKHRARLRLVASPVEG